MRVEGLSCDAVFHGVEDGALRVSVDFLVVGTLLARVTGSEPYLAENSVHKPGRSQDLAVGDGHGRIPTN